MRIGCSSLLARHFGGVCDKKPLERLMRSIPLRFKVLPNIQHRDWSPCWQPTGIPFQAPSAAGMALSWIRSFFLDWSTLSGQIALRAGYRPCWHDRCLCLGLASTTFAGLLCQKSSLSDRGALSCFVPGESCRLGISIPFQFLRCALGLIQGQRRSPPRTIEPPGLALGWSGLGLGFKFGVETASVWAN